MSKFRIKNYAPVTHNNCRIYIRSLGQFFEYLAVVHGEIYTASLIVKPRLVKEFLNLLHLSDSLYSEKEENAAVSYMMKMGQTTVETVTKKIKL